MNMHFSQCLRVTQRYIQMLLNICNKSVEQTKLCIACNYFQISLRYQSIVSRFDFWLPNFPRNSMTFGAIVATKLFVESRIKAEAIDTEQRNHPKFFNSQIRSESNFWLKHWQMTWCSVIQHIFDRQKHRVLFKPFMLRIFICFECSPDCRCTHTMNKHQTGFMKRYYQLCDPRNRLQIIPLHRWTPPIVNNKIFSSNSNATSFIHSPHSLFDLVGFLITIEFFGLILSMTIRELIDTNPHPTSYILPCNRCGYSI